MSTVKQNRFNAILDAATALLIEKPGASMAEIAERAGIGIATLHRYVDSREQLMAQLGFRAIEVVTDIVGSITFQEERYESYFPELIKALIPIGDKIYFLGHDASVHYNKEIEEADKKLREPLLRNIELLQEKGYFRKAHQREWIADVLYSLLFLTWQQVQDGHIAKNKAAELVLDTFFNGFKSSSQL
jgi:AcrR family transcriptional regulator